MNDTQIPKKGRQQGSSLTNELARERTDWAFERTVLAKERTYSAWVRTGIALVGAGLGFARLLRTLQPRWAVSTLSVILVSAGALIFALGFWRYYQPLRGDEAITGVPTWLIGVLTTALLLAAGLGVWLLW